MAFLHLPWSLANMTDGAASLVFDIAGDATVFAFSFSVPRYSCSTAGLEEVSTQSG